MFLDLALKILLVFFLYLYLVTHKNNTYMIDEQMHIYFKLKKKNHLSLYMKFLRQIKMYKNPVDKIFYLLS